MIKNLCLLALLCFAAVAVSAQEKAPAPKTVSGGVVNGKAQNLPKPEYPPAALAVRASGAVNVQVTIDETGVVISAAAVSGHPLLRAAAVEAAKQARFSPTLLNGEPVKVTGVIVYNFVAPAVTENHEERFKLVAVGMVLSLARSEKLLKTEVFTELPSEATDLAAELTTLKTLKDLSPADREQTLARVTDAIRARLSGPEAKEFEIGLLFGNIMLELSKHEEDRSYRPDETLLKANLSQIKSLLASTGPNFPAAVMDQFVLFTELAEKPDLTSDENLTTLMFRMMRIIETLSPETFK